tara:strand:+ start:5938 stop:6120 length:183 start_codon:yes stop_codon:yes gene_type:complete
MKKGEITIQWLVVAIIAILFLVILVIVYQSELSQLFGGTQDIIDNVLGNSKDLNIEGAIQ